MPQPRNDSDDAIIAFVDEWVTLLEREEYSAAFEHTEQRPGTDWSPELIAQIIQAYARDDNDPPSHVTLLGKPTDISQRKEITRWDQRPDGRFGYLCYDLNINGFASDLTALFDLYRTGDGGVRVLLDDIHVM